MARRDFRNRRQSWKHNPFVGAGAGALAQAVAPFLDWAKLQKTEVAKFNDKGRPDHITKWVDFQCIVTQDEYKRRSATAGGDRSEVNFTVMWLKPAELPLGSILIHDTFGAMKITSINGLVDVGLCSATAVGISAGVEIEDGKSISVEQRDIF